MVALREQRPMIHELVARQLTSDGFVASLQRYAELSRAAQHPLLDLLAAGGFRAARTAMRRFFTEYRGYSRRFTRFLASVMAGLERPEHRAARVPNSAEEAGAIDDHHRAELRAAGIDPDDDAAPHPQLPRHQHAGARGHGADGDARGGAALVDGRGDHRLVVDGRAGDRAPPRVDALGARGLER